MANNDIHFIRKELDDLQTNMANFNVTTEYAQSLNDSIAPTTGWSTTKPAPTEGRFIWARNIMNMGYGDVISEPYCIGDGLEHILSIDVEYIVWSDAYLPPSQSSEFWQTTAPSIQSGQYIWTRTKIVTTEGVNYTDPLRVTGEKGEQGQGVSIKGDAGKGFDFIYITTGNANYNTTPADNVSRTENQYDPHWCDSPTPVNQSHPYIFMSMRTTGSDGEWGHWSSPVLMSSIGEKGEDGEGFEIIFTRTNSDTPVPNFSYNGQNQGVTGYTGVDDNNKHYQDADFTPHGWTDNQQGVDSDHKYEWASFRFKTVTNGEASWGNFNTPKIWATYSEDGESNYIHIRYSAVNNPSSFSQTSLSPESNTLYIGVYVSNSQSEPSSVNSYSWKKWIPENGVDYDGRFLHIKYASDVTFNQDDSVNTVTFTGNNGEDAGAWLGTCFTTTSTDPTDGTVYNWVKIEGNGISSIQEQYALSDSYLTAPQNEADWQQLNGSLPNPQSSGYYWTRNYITFTDGSHTVTNAICVSGLDGNGSHYIYYCCDSLQTPPLPLVDHQEVPANTGKIDWTHVYANDKNDNSNNYDKWVEDPVAVASNKKYLYVSVSTSHYYENGVKLWKDFSEPTLWGRYTSEGGDDGKGYEYAYYTSDTYYTNNSNPPLTKPNANATITVQNSANVWSSAPVPMTKTNKYMYICYRTMTGNTYDNDGVWSNPALFSMFGSDGSDGNRGAGSLSISDTSLIVTNTKTLQTTGTTPPLKITIANLQTQSGFNDFFVGDYIRTGTIIYPVVFVGDNWVYLDNPISIRGATGKAVGSVVNYYATSTTDSAPSSNSNEWVDSISSLAHAYSSTYKYLWNKEVSFDEDDDVISETTPIIIGTYGESGGTISVIDEKYMITSSATVPLASNSNWSSSIPTMSSTNKYLWNKTTITYDNPSSTGKPKIRIIAIYGDTGDDGADGKDGLGIEHIFYRSDEEINWSTYADPSSENALLHPSNWTNLTDYNDGGTTKSFSDDDFFLASKDWRDDPLSVTPEYKYQYCAIRTKSYANDGKTAVWEAFGTPFLWSNYAEDGSDGDAGQGFEYAYKLHDKDGSNNTVPTEPSGNISNPNNTRGLWTTIPLEMSNDDYPYTFISYRTSNENGVWSTWSTPTLWNTISAGIHVLPSNISKTSFSDEAYPNSRWRIDISAVTNAIGVKLVLNEQVIIGNYIYPVTYCGSAKYHLGDGTLIKGADGLGMEHIFYLTNTEVADWDSVTGNTNPVNWAVKPNTDDYYGQDITGNQWTDDATGVDATHKYEYVSIRKKEYDADGKTAKWGAFSKPSLWAKFGADGKSITRVVNYYATNNDGAEAPEKTDQNTWYTDINDSNLVFDSTHRYLWNYEVSYSGNEFISETEPVAIAYWTKDGKGIQSIVEHYAISNSNTTTPKSSAWHSTTDNDFYMPVTTNEKRYLWNYETIYFTVGDPYVSPKRVIGTHGESGASIVFAYYTTNSDNYSGSPSGTLATGNNKDHDTWCATPYPTSADYPLLYVSTKTTASGSTWSNASLMSRYGKDGSSGSSGTGYEYAYYTTSSTPNPVKPSTVATGNNKDYNKWCDTPMAMTDSATKIYISYRTKVDNTITKDWSDGALFSIRGTDGSNGIDGTDGHSVYTLDSNYQPTSHHATTQAGIEYFYRREITQVDANTNATSLQIGDFLICGDYMYQILSKGVTYYGLSDRTKLKGEQGERGVKGYDGVGFEMIFYCTNNPSPTWDSTNNPATLDTTTSAYQTADYYPSSMGWTDDPQGVSSQYKYEFASVRTSDRDGVWSAFSTPSLHSKFGDDGIGIEYIYAVNNSTTAPTFVTENNKSQQNNDYTGTVNNKQFSDDDFIPSGWNDDPVSVSANNKYCWVSQRTKGADGWSSFSNPSIWARYGEDGADGNKIYEITTAPPVYPNQSQNPQWKYRLDLKTLSEEIDIDDVQIGDIFKYDTYFYHVDYKVENRNSTYWFVYFGERTDLQGDEGERGTHIIEITESPTYSSSGYTYDNITYYYKKQVSRILSESGESEVKVGDYLKYDTTLYLVEYIDNGWVYLVETELAPDMENIDASLLNGKESTEFMTSIPEMDSISQTGGGTVECWKFGQLILVKVSQCVVTNTATGNNVGSSWEKLKQSGNTNITLKDAYKPSTNIIKCCGTQSTNTKNTQLRLGRDGTFEFKRAGFGTPTTGDSETVDATFIYFHDTRTETTLVDTKNWNANSITSGDNACIGDSLEVQLKTGNTVMSGCPIVFSINDVNYQRTTDSEGKASLTLNLPKKTGTNGNDGYSWSAKFNGDKTYKLSTAGQTKMPLYACGGYMELDYIPWINPRTPFMGTIYNNHDKPVKGVVVTVTVAGMVSFSSTTNEYGKFAIYHYNDGIVYGDDVEWECVFTVDNNKVATLNTTHNGESYPTRVTYPFRNW